MWKTLNLLPKLNSFTFAVILFFVFSDWPTSSAIISESHNFAAQTLAEHTMVANLFDNI